MKTLMTEVYYRFRFETDYDIGADIAAVHIFRKQNQNR